MKPDDDRPTIDPVALDAIVERAAGSNVLPLHDITVSPIVGGVGNGLGTFRVSGTGGTDRIVWSVVLKVIGRTDGPHDPARWDSWDREATAYRSALLDSLPGGITAARCFDVVAVDPDTMWLWLEDLGDDVDGTWTLDDHATVAGAFGELGGRHVDDPELAALPWLSRGWLRDWVEENADAMAALASSLEDPWVRRAWPNGEAEILLRHWEERERRLAVLDRLPRTLCHFDVFRRNLHARTDGDGGREVVALDWAFVGLGAPGEDLVPMVLGNVAFGEISPVAAVELERRALDAYVSGMRRAGWDGDPRIVELGYAVAGTYRYTVGVMRLFLPFLLGEVPLQIAEHVFGSPFHEIAEATGIVTSRHALRLATVADRLTVELGLG